MLVCSMAAVACESPADAPTTSPLPTGSVVPEEKPVAIPTSTIRPPPPTASRTPPPLALETADRGSFPKALNGVPAVIFSFRMIHPNDVAFRRVGFEVRWPDSRCPDRTLPESGGVSWEGNAPRVRCECVELQDGYYCEANGKPVRGLIHGCHVTRCARRSGFEVSFRLLEFADRDFGIPTGERWEGATVFQNPPPPRPVE